MLGSGNKFDPNKDIPDLAGKIFVVTGGSAGIGYGICAHLLQHKPEKIYLLGKKEEHIAEAEKGLTAYGDIAKIESIQIELEDLHQTDQVAKSLAKKLNRLDALICNAGLGVGKYSETKDGLDSHMQVNHIAQYHLAMILMPVLQKTPDSRLVLQSSELHRGINDVNFASEAELNTDIGAMKLYNRTKLAQVLTVRSFADLKERGEFGLNAGKDSSPWFIATHPGGIQTDQQKQAVEAYGTLGKIGVAAVKPLLGDPVDEGCRPALFAATSQDVANEKLQGVYIVPDRKVNDVDKTAKDTKLGDNLWKLTEEILQQRLGKLPYPTRFV